MENVTRKLLKKAKSTPILKCELISLYKVLTNLCNNHELHRLIKLCGFSKDLSEKLRIRLGRAYKNVEAKAIELFKKMPYKKSLSYHFKHMLLELLWPIVYKILQWKSFYTPSIDDVFLQHFYWTDRGTIDNIKTARQIIKNEIIPIRKRFMLACRLCLYEDIQELWREMSDDDKTEITRDNREPLFHLLQFWKNKLQIRRVQLEVAEREPAEGETAKRELVEFQLPQLEVEELPREELDNVLKCAAEFGSLEAVKYLFRMMDENEKSDKAVLCYILVRKKLRYLDVLEEEEIEKGYFLFSQMSEQKQFDMLRSDFTVVVSFLQYFPEQELLLEFLRYKMANISKIDFLIFLISMYFKLQLDTFKDCDYCNLFIRIWKILPYDLKTSLKDCWFMVVLYSELIFYNFRFVLNKSSPKKRKCLNEKRFGSYQDKWKLVHFLIEEEIVTAKTLKQHREVVEYFLNSRKNEKVIFRRLLNFIINKSKAKRN